MATAFERLFIRIEEITEIVNLASAQGKKKTEVISMIKERFQDLKDIGDSSFNNYIYTFPFVFNEINNLKQQNFALQAELNEVKQENTALHNELDKFRYELSKDDKTAQELDRVRKENESLKSELDNLRQNLDKGVCDMDMMTEIQDLKSRVTAIETSLDKSVSNLDIPEYVDTWKVTIRDGYYKLYKTINSKLIWIHLGRNFNEGIAKKKIQEKLSKLDKNVSKDTL